MIVLATPAAERDSVEFRNALEMAGDAGRGLDISQTQTDVDGVQIPMTLSRYRSGWAASADLGQVAIALYGSDVSPDSVSLTTVNDRLADYRQPPLD